MLVFWVKDYTTLKVRGVTFFTILLCDFHIDDVFVGLTKTGEIIPVGLSPMMESKAMLRRRCISRRHSGSVAIYEQRPSRKKRDGTDCAIRGRHIRCQVDMAQ